MNDQNKMSPISVLWLPPGSQHDTYQFELLFSGRVWSAVRAYNFDYFYAFEDVPSDSEGLIVVCPSKYYIDKVDWLNEQIARFKYLLWVQSGNEEITIDPSAIKHPNKKIYYTTPNPAMAHLELIDRMFGDGYAPQSEVLSEMGQEALDKPLDVYFGGQITHSRRELAVEAIKSFRDNNKDRNVELFETAGFYQGYDDPREYYKRLASAKIAPCPSGPQSVDTFRLYEALQAMAIPIADTKTPNDSEPTRYWGTLFGEAPPFGLINEWHEIDKYIVDAMQHWPANVNGMTAWWINYKRQTAYNLVADLKELIG